MSTSKVVLFEEVRKGKQRTFKKLVLTPAQFKEVVPTDKKRANVARGITTRVRREGVVHRYFGPKSRKAAKITKSKAA